MVENIDQFGGTVASVNLGSNPSSQSAAPLDSIGPCALAELMLLCPLHLSAGLVVLEPQDGVYSLTIRRRNLTIGGLLVPLDVGAAAAIRLALVTGIDPLADGESLHARSDMARIKVRAGTDTGEVLVSIRVGAGGLVVEVAALSVNGCAAETAGGGSLKRCFDCGTFQPFQRTTCEPCGAALTEIADDPCVGGTIGAYRIIGAIGEGGMGVVFSGEHALIGRPVAIKLIHAKLAQSSATARRFLLEARATSRLSHPNIVEVTDFGLLANGQPYMVMEWLVGESLEERLEREGALRPLVALRVAREIASALVVAHDGGVIHNDLKPSNVMLLHGSTDEAILLKLIDFGAASFVGESGAGEPFFGTPAYMPPERAGGEPTDGRSDIYALGVLLFEMLSGAVPFDGDTASELLIAHVAHPPPPLTSPFGALPRSVGRIVARALAKKPEVRHQLARELVADLDCAITAFTRTDWRRWLPS